jgi:ParB family transcriptional regulator, chromosome partitioning protein
MTHAGQLGEALKLDMADYWQPTAASYFGRVSKAQAIDAVTEAVSAKDAAPLAALKKDDLVKAAETMLAGKNWLPAILRTA